MARDNFRALHELLKNHPVFNNAKSNYPGRSESHLLTLMHFIGHRCINAHITNHALFVGYGTHYNYIMKAVEAVCSLQKIIHWPDVSEREEIVKRMKDNHDFPSCVMVGDETLFPLEFAPQSSDSGEYSGYNYKYSITFFVMNDDQKSFRSYLAGWTGSVKDNCVYRKTDVLKRPNTHFSPGQYMLTDSAVDDSD